MAPSDSTRGKSPAFQFYPRDFLLSRKVRDMSLTERGAYITLLSMDWLEGGLPTDLDKLAKDLDVPAARFRKMWVSGPLCECFIEKNGRLTNPRLQEERRKQADYRRRQSDNGAKGGRPKKGLGNSGESQPEATQQPTQKLSSASAFASAFVPTEKQKISAEPPRDSTPVALTFETVGHPPSWNLHQSRIDSWLSAYPNLDVLGECRKASVWLDANRDKRKTAKGMPAFLVRWFGNAVDRPRGQDRAVSNPRTAGNQAALARFVARGQES